MSLSKAFRTRGKAGAILGALALSGSLIAVTAVNASAASSSKTTARATTVKPDLAFFKGKTITFDEYGAPASAPDIQALTLATYMGQYLHATVNVVYVQGGSGLVSQNLAATAAPNGLTIGSLNPSGDIGLFVNNTPGLEFNLRSVPLLPSLPPTNTVIVTNPTSGFKTFNQLVHSPRPVTELASVGSTVGVQSQLLFGAFKIPNHFIYGYINAAALVTGMSRGDGDATMQAFTVFQSMIIGHQVDVALQMLPPLKGEDGYSIVKNVPTLEEYAAKNPPKTADGKAELQMLENLTQLSSTPFVPVGTPVARQEALAKAIEWASTRPAAKKTLLNVGLGSGYVLPQVVKKKMDAVIASQSKLAQWLQETGAP